jgi:hypothetical protein
VAFAEEALVESSALPDAELVDFLTRSAVSVASAAAHAESTA